VPTYKFLVLSGGLFRKDAGDNLNAGRAQSVESFAGDERIRVNDRTNDPLDPCDDERLGARWGFPMMTMRLERNIRRPTACAVPSPLQSDNLGVCYPCEAISSLAGYFAIHVQDHAADERVWAHIPDAGPGEIKCTARKFYIAIRYDHQLKSPFT
jgi:hypothetical protein